MDWTDPADVGRRLDALDAALLEETAEGAADRAVVDLDQQSVGRLSRMDALQRQAMAASQERRRIARRQRIQAARARLEAGEFGFCEECGDDIGANRLETDPTTPLCISCARG
ncbi:MAG: TraR/DksA C4-type zinc finger protein [Pseudomonadota bacterium]